jgi:hypothetical protein
MQVLGSVKVSMSVMVERPSFAAGAHPNGALRFSKQMCTQNLRD